MADVQGSMFFCSKTGSRVAGWSENVYILNATDLPGALTKLQSLAPVRSRLCGSGGWMPYLRVSDRLIFRDSQVSGGPPGPSPVRPALPRPPLRAAIDGAGTTSAPAPSAPNDYIYDNDLRAEALASGNVADLRCDMPWSGVVLRAEGGSTFQSRRSILLRGLPDYIIQTATDVPQAGHWSDNLQAYIDKLKTGDYGFRAIDLSAANPILPVTAINTTTVTPVFTLTVPPAPGGGAGTAPLPGVGQSVRIQGNKMVTPAGLTFNVNGIWVVLTNPAPGQYTFRDMTVPALNMNVLQMGGARIRKFVVLPFNKILMRRWGKRPVGNPFDPF